MGSQQELPKYQLRNIEESEDSEDEHVLQSTSTTWNGEEKNPKTRRINLDTEPEIQEPEIHEAFQANGSRTPIGPYDLHLIRPGDHIGWHRPYVIWHHAIVVEVDKRGRKLKVIHFHRPNKFDIRQKIITEQWIDVDEERGYLFRFNYEDAYPPDIVIRRARAKVGKGGYDLFKYNCEHFATECKIGTPHSAQVKWAWGKTKQTLKEGAVNVTTGSVKLGCKVVKEMSKQGAKGVIVSAGKVGGTEMAEKIAKGSNWVGAGALAGVEVFHCANDIYHIHKQYKAGKMTKRDFQITSTQRVSEGVVGGGAAIGGSILGEYWGAAAGGAIGSAVPVIGTAIGAAVGAFVGSVAVGALGSAVGKAVGSIFGSWFGNWIW